MRSLLKYKNLIKVDYSYNAITTLSDLNTINDNPISKGLDKRYVQKVDIVIQDLG